MKKVETKLLSWSSYSNIYTFEVPSYSKLLDKCLTKKRPKDFYIRDYKYFFKLDNFFTKAEIRDRKLNKLGI
jgi:hypothetical protein